MKTVRVHNNVVIEILEPVSGFSLEQCFHPSIFDTCSTVEDDVQVGWTRQEDGSWTAPVAESGADQ
jgi:hypothetical protein